MTSTDGITPETAALAGRVRREAAQLPDREHIRELGEAAARHGSSGMSREDIRHLADTAIGRPEQVTDLLRQLSGLLGDPPGPDDGSGP